MRLAKPIACLLAVVALIGDAAAAGSSPNRAIIIAIRMICPILRRCSRISIRSSSWAS
jgi:hypothetical protein